MGLGLQAPGGKIDLHTCQYVLYDHEKMLNISLPQVLSNEPQICVSC